MENSELKASLLRVHQLLLDQGLALGVAESCTGGLLGAELSSTPGASAYFRGGVIAYANDVKAAWLGVSPRILRKMGAVSAECAAAMASGLLKLCRIDLALSVTGIAGPDGGSATKPVGTFYLGIAGPKGVEVQHHFCPGERDFVRVAAVLRALRLLEGYLNCNYSD